MEYLRQSVETYAYHIDNYPKSTLLTSFNISLIVMSPLLMVTALLFPMKPPKVNDLCSLFLCYTIEDSSKNKSIEVHAQLLYPSKDFFGAMYYEQLWVCLEQTLSAVIRSTVSPDLLTIGILGYRAMKLLNCITSRYLPNRVLYYGYSLQQFMGSVINPAVSVIIRACKSSRLKSLCFPPCATVWVQYYNPQHLFALACTLELVFAFHHGANHTHGWKKRNLHC